MSLITRLRALERHAPGEPNPWASATFWERIGDDLYRCMSTGEVAKLENVPAFTIVVDRPDQGEVNE